MKRDDSKTTGIGVRTAIAGVLAVGVTGLVAGAASAAPDWAAGLKEIEKCGGIAKAGKNDCGTKNHTCGGQAKSDNLAANRITHVGGAWLAST